MKDREGHRQTEEPTKRNRRRNRNRQTKKDIIELRETDRNNTENEGQRDKHIDRATNRQRETE